MHVPCDGGQQAARGSARARCKPLTRRRPGHERRLCDDRGVVSEWRSGRVVANGIGIHYTRTGGDRRPLVLSHGFGDSGLCWIGVARALAPDYDVILPDARGHGRSDAPETGYAATDRARDLAELIRALDLGRPAIGGHSMGAATSLYCAALDPELVAAMILEDPALWLPGADPWSRDAETRAVRRRAETDRYARLTRDELVAESVREHPTWDADEHEPWADAKKDLSPRVGFGRPARESPTWQEALARVACPTLLITADPALGAIVTPEAAAEAQRILPSLRVIRIEGAGHNIRRDAFEPFTAAVRDFLAEVDRPV
jgi:N-formylmaleamate deformylase